MEVTKELCAENEKSCILREIYKGKLKPFSGTFRYSVCPSKNICWAVCIPSIPSGKHFFPPSRYQAINKQLQFK
jgi:hypothetical protein